jgi:UDP-N-acetyl-D-glucosamine dehydrogenase
MTPAPKDVAVCIVGMGYVGLPLAVALAESGRAVTGFDVNSERIEQLSSGVSPVEDISADELKLAIEDGLTFTDDITAAAAATAYVICVPTPLREHQPDLTFVESAAAAVASVLSAGDLVVLESTTYPGTTEEVVGPILERGSGLLAGSGFDLAYSPERIDPGNKTFTLQTTPKVVSGATEQAGDRAEALYRDVVGSIVRTRGTREAEMAKLLENTFRHVNIALINELAVFCRTLDIDIWDVIDAASSKPFGFMPFRPGPGVGGHCIPVDPSYLSWAVRKHGFQFHFVELAQEINERMPDYTVSRVADILNDHGLAMSRSRILCLGVAYKPDVGDCRESPAMEVIKRLRARGADVHYADPHVATVTLEGAVLTAETEEDVSDYDLVVLLTPHSSFDLDRIAGDARAFFDTRGVVSPGPSVQRL